MTDAEIRALGEEHGWNIAAMSRAIGKVSGAFERRARALRPNAGPPKEPIILQPPPSSDLPIRELVALRKRKFECKEKHEEGRKLIPVRLPKAARECASCVPLGSLNGWIRAHGMDGKPA